MNFFLIPLVYLDAKLGTSNGGKTKQRSVELAPVLYLEGHQSHAQRSQKEWVQLIYNLSIVGSGTTTSVSHTDRERTLKNKVNPEPLIPTPKIQQLTSDSSASLISPTRFPKNSQCGCFVT